MLKHVLYSIHTFNCQILIDVKHERKLAFNSIKKNQVRSRTKLIVACMMSYN